MQACTTRRNGSVPEKRCSTAGQQVQNRECSGSARTASQSPYRLRCTAAGITESPQDLRHPEKEVQQLLHGSGTSEARQRREPDASPRIPARQRRLSHWFWFHPC